MNYFSFEFAVLFICFLFIYWAFRRKLLLQNILLLFFNYFLLIAFFGHVYFAIVVGCYSIVVYCFGLWLKHKKTLLLLFSVVFLVILNLFFFKYFPLLKASIDSFVQMLGYTPFDLLFPLGLSFYTFASITYFVHAYRTQSSANFLEIATYLSFFPTIVAGPIVDSQFFFKQLRKRRIFKDEGFILTLILLALIKKVLIANYLGIWTTQIFENPTSYDSLTLILGAYAYSFQLYCDFSGYVNLVMAFALLLGFTLPKNFDAPLLARNIQDFWNRWHISLSLFIRNYIYIPLGGNRHGTYRMCVNIMIAFVFSGIWHTNTQDGSNTLNFAIWGALHGIAVCILHAMRSIELQLPYILAVFLTFNYVSFCWIFFMLPSFDKSAEYIYSIFYNSVPIANHTWIYCLGVWVILYVYKITRPLLSYSTTIFTLTPMWLRPLLLICALLFIFALAPDGIPNFIYARF